MKPNELSDLPILLASCETPEDFAEYDRIKAEVLAAQATRGRWHVATLGDVAEFFGAALQTVKQWRMESPPMPGVPGNYPLPEITKWRRDKDLQTDLVAGRRQQDFDLAKIRIRDEQIDLNIKEGLILDRQDVELWAATAMVELRESIMQLPEKLAASAPESLKNFVRSESDAHCRDSLIAASRRLDMMEIGKDRGGAE